MGKYSCEACKKKCKKEAVRLQDKYFHVKCFMCKECKKPLATDGFFTKDGEHYCDADYQRLFATHCKGCGKVVEGEAVTVLGNSYHKNCFHCSKCGKKFELGEKATFVNGEHWCHGCVEEEEDLAAAAAHTPVPGITKNNAAGTAATIEIPASPASPESDQRRDVIKTKRESELQSPTSDCSQERNGSFNEDESMKLNRDSFQNGTDERIASETNGRKPVKELPRVFGMPDNKFYNSSYLSRPNPEFKRGGVTANAVAKDPAVMHYHRPDNFSYTNLRKDFKSEVVVNAPGSKKELILQSKNPDGQMKNLAPIERDDWPGPPEPAAAYPELLRKRVPDKEVIDSEKAAPENQRVSKEIEELAKMTDSGAATVILRDLQKKRSRSPTLDPRNSSRAPSAAMEPPHKPRYDTPYFASPSRNLDMKRRPHSCFGKEYDSSGVSSNAPQALYGRTCITLRPGSCLDQYKGYQSDGYGELEYRPKTSIGVVQEDSIDAFNDRSIDYDPTTGLRRSAHLKSSTLPVGMSGRFLLENIQLASIGNKDFEPVKIYPYEQLIRDNAENLTGVNHYALERHLSKEEFEKLFKMGQTDFYRLPLWKRNEEKTLLGLI